MIDNIANLDGLGVEVDPAVIEDMNQYLKGILSLGSNPLSDDHRNYDLGVLAGYFVAFGIEDYDTYAEWDTVPTAKPTNWFQSKAAAMDRDFTGPNLRRHLYACGILRGYKLGIAGMYDEAECTSCDRGLRTQVDEVIECECGTFCNRPTHACFDEFDHSRRCIAEHSDTGWEKP